MKYGQPLISTELSGKLGGIVGATARGGIGYFRRRVTGSNPMSVLQTQVRAIITALSGNWKDVLTSSQRNSWADKASPKESGIDVYVKSNFNLALTGATLVATAPSSIALPDPPLTSVSTYDIGTKTISFLPNGDAGTTYSIYTTKPQSPSRLSRQNPYQYTTTQTADAGDIVFEDGTNPTLNTTTTVFYIKFVPWNMDGQVGQEQEFRVTCVA